MAKTTANTDTAVRDAYAANLPGLSTAALLDDLESSIRQNTYGSHDDQIAILRAEVHARTAPVPAAADDAADGARYELVQEIRRMGDRVQRAITDYRDIADAATRALEEGSNPWGATAQDNPVQVLRDMEALVKVAQQLGVSQDVILRARRGEFVSHIDYITGR